MPGGPSSRRPVGGRKIVSDSNSSAVSRWRDPSPPRSSIISTPPPPRSAVRSPPSRSIFGSPPPRSILTSPSQRSTISVGLSEPPGDEDASAWLGEDDTDSWFQLDQTVGGSKKGGRTVPSEPLVPRPKAKVPWNPANAKPKAAAKPPLAKKVPVKDPWSFAFDSDEDKKETTSAAPSPAAKVAEAPAAQAPEPAPAQADAWDVPVDAPEQVATPPPPQTKVVSAKKPAVAKPKAPVKNEDNFWDLDSYKKETKSPAPSKPAIRSKPGLLKKEVKAPIAPKPPVVRETKTVPQTQPVPEPEVVPVPRHVPITAPEPVVEAVPEPKQPEPEHEPEAQLEPEREPEPEPAPVEEPFEPEPEPETHAAETTDPWAADVKTEEVIPHGDLSTDLDAADDLVDDKTLDAQWQEAFTTGTDSWDLGEEDIEQYVPETHEAAPELETPAHEPTTDAWSVDIDSEQQPLAETAAPAIEQQDSWALDTETPSHIEPETEAPEAEQPAAWSFETEEPVTEPGQEATDDLEISQPDAKAPATKEADPWTFDVEEPAAEPIEEEVPEVEAHQAGLHEQPSKDTDAWSTFDNEPPAASVEPSFSAVEPVQPTEQDADEVDFWSSTDHSAHPAPTSDAQLPAVEDSEKPAEQADLWSFDAEEPLDEPFATEVAEEPQISTDAAPEVPSAEEHATAEEETDAWDVEADEPAHDELVADSKEEPSQDADPWAFEVDEEAPQQEESFPEPEQVPESAEPAHTQETETEAADAGAFSFDVEEGDQDEAMNWGAADEEVAPAVEAPEINEPSSPAAQSTKSFARTVSHDVSFNDDDDADWNLSRTDSDPFKFMPPSTRTNSFPSVPPATKEPTHALQSNQALDILEETEAEDQQTEATHDASAEDVMGGELHHAETEAAEARFEEGIPLLPTETETEEAEPAQQTDHAFAHSFGDEEGDDFFNQKQHDDAEEGEPAFEPVQRKSTIQVMDRAAEGTADNEPLDVEAPTSVAAIAEEPQEESANADGDLGSKWEAAFGEDDDEGFLPEEQDTTAPAAEHVDATGFLGSDDEGLLLEDEVAPAPAEAVQPEAPSKPAATNRYAPAAQNHRPAQLPSSVSAPSLNYNLNQSSPAPPPLPAADETKVTSFADRSKSGYSSPYDLPTDLISTRIKPRKSIQQLRNAPAPPQKDAAVTAPPPPAPGAFSKPPAQSKPSAGPPRAKENFFEELPITTKSRPQSRHSNRAPSPAQVPPMPTGPPRLPHQAAVVEEASEVHKATEPERQPPANIAKLVAPERVDPYAALPGGGPPAPFAANANRYSPAPSQSGKSASAPPPAAASNRYSPAPVQPAHSHSQSPPQAQLPHLPRTSSPLANFEVTNGKTAGEPGHPDRRASSAYDHKASRVSSLPPTTEVDEEDDDEQPATGRSMSAAYPAGSQPQGRYSPKPTENKMPPTSPSKRAPNAYTPQAHGHQQPPRSQTQSPSTLRGKPHMSPVYEGRTGLPPPAAGSNVIKASTQSAYAGFGRPRGASLTMGLVPPTDGSENDPLNRWQGAPIIAWGVGGTMVTVFPKSIPRYGMNQSAPTTLRTSGEVKMHTIKDAAPMPERLTKFPGPLKGKSKKKEALAWLASGIDALSQDLPDVSLHQHLSLEAKRSIERLLLWKLLRVFVEHDGHLEGNPAVEQAVRDVLSPTDNAAENAGMLSNGATFGSMQTSAVTAMQADVVDSGAIEQIRNDLLKGDRETAVWSAVDKRLWGHAMLIANTVSPDLYQRVAQEFVRKEVNYTGHNNESLGAFYKILSGNHDDCVDELVPSHARAGLQLMSTQVASVPTADIMDGLDKWRETLSLVLSNRSTDDIRGLKSLGQLLSSYGRAEAAQICFIFSRGISVFGGADEPNVDFVLLGADHRTQSDSFAKETEALQLSEVYEYALSLGGGAAATAGAPHLAGYKLHYAVNLAEYGMRDKALAYCDSIANAITAQTKRSPYYHPVLETAVDDFMKRLKQAPKDDSASWMSKPSMNKVSDSMWNRFNKFVAGDESDANGSGPEAESGPFARIASTPNLSRSPSVNNFDVYGGGAAATYPASNVPPPMPLGNPTTSSKYAPMGGAGAAMPPPFEYQPPVPGPASNGRSASPYTPAAYEPSYSSQPVAQAPTHGYPGAPTESNYGYQPRAYEPPVPEAEPAAPVPAAEEKDSFQAPSFVPYGAPEPESTQSFQPSTYEPPQVSAPVEEVEKEDKAQEEEQGGSGGFEPPSFQPYGYEPPSYQPPPPAEEEEHDDEAPKPKKKTFMDDDNDDDIPALRDPASQEKTKEQIDKENADLVKKIAEDEAKREAEQIAAKKSAGWGFGGWFGGAKKADNLDPGKKAIRAKLGEANSFVYDPELKRWINKAAGAEQVEAAKPAPPPPKGGPRSVSGTPPPMMATPPPMPRSASTSMAPPPRPQSAGIPPPLPRPGSSAGNSGPPSRPATSMSNASSIDDLLGAAAPRKAGKKPRKSGRYVDVMAK